MLRKASLMLQLCALSVSAVQMLASRLGIFQNFILSLRSQRLEDANAISYKSVNTYIRPPME